MRVVVLADFGIADGGAPRVAMLSARALAERGVAVTFIHAVGTKAEPVLDHPGIERIGLDEKGVHDRGALAGAASGVWNAPLARRLRGVLAALPPGPRVIHLHQWTKAFSPSLFPVLLNGAAPLVVTLHDYFLLCPTGLFYRFDRGEPCRLRPLSAACCLAPCDPASVLHKGVRVLRGFATKLAIGRRALHVVHVSDRGAATAGAFLPPGAISYRLDNPVEIGTGPEVAPAALGEKLVFMGRLTEEKGARLVADAAVRAGFAPLFIGDGPLAGELRALFGTEAVTGWMAPAAALARLRTEARALVAPSLWPETGPLTIYEALANGIPVIGSERAGASEKIRDGETGFVLPPEGEAIAKAARALADRAIAARMGQAAHSAYWAAPLSPERHAAALTALYRHVLDAAGASQDLPIESDRPARH